MSETEKSKEKVRQPGSRLVSSDVGDLAMRLKSGWRKIALSAKRFYLFHTFWLAVVLLLIVAAYTGFVVYTFLYARVEADPGSSEVELKLNTSRLDQLQLWRDSRLQVYGQNLRVPAASFSSRDEL